MTDDEIRAALIPTLAKHYGLTETVVRPAHEIERLAYRAGMRRAARVARNTAGEFFAASNVERSIGADIAAAAIDTARKD